MTKYLVGRRYVTEPWMEVYECGPAGVLPVLVPFEPPFAGEVERTKFSDDQTLMASVTRYRREDMEGLGGAADVTAASSAVWFSPDEQFAMTANPPAFYKRRGPYFIPVPETDFPFGDVTGQTIATATISEKADVVTFSLSGSPNVVAVYDRNEGTETWTLKVADLLGTVTWGTNTRMVITDDSQYIFVYGATGPQSIYQLIDNDYEPIGLASPNRLLAWIEKPDGTWRLGFDNAGAPGTTLNVYDLDAGVLTPMGSVPVDTDFTGRLMGVMFGHGGETCFYEIQRSGTGSTTNVFIRGYQSPEANVAWTSFFSQAGGGNRPFGGQGMALDATGTKLAASISHLGVTLHQFWVWTIAKSAGVYSATLVGSVNMSASRNVLRFNPEGTIVHMTGEHRSPVYPLPVVTPLDVAPGGASGNVSNVTYSPSGQISWANTSFETAPIMMIRDGKGDYLNFKTLEGTFVNVFDRDSAGFKERAFVQHILDTVISDLLFSPDGSALSYFAADPGGGVSGLGRFVYDLATDEADVLFRAAIALPDDEASFAAFNPDTTYMAVVFRNAVVGNNIRLYSLSATKVPTEVDMELVAFGPVAYSKCETVVVSHGGPEPYTLYNHVTTPADGLEVIPVPDIEWSTDSDILAVAFTSDCTGLVIVTPDEIVVIDPETGETDDQVSEGPGDGTDGSQVDIQPDPSDPEGEDTQIIVVPPPTTPGGVWTPGPGWSVDTGGHDISNFAYIPYVAINVTFRTR